MIFICNCQTEVVLYQLFCCDFCGVLQVLGKSLTGLPHLRVKFKTENIQPWNVLLSSHKLYKHLPMHTCIIEIKYKGFIKHVTQILTTTHYFVKPKPFLQSMQNEWKSTEVFFSRWNDLHFPYILIKHHGPRSPRCYSHIIFTLVHDAPLPPVIGALLIAGGRLGVWGVLLRALLSIATRSVTGQSKAIRAMY